MQGLITQDIDRLDMQKMIYACLLTPQGKFLFDFFIREQNNRLLIDCEGGERARALLKKLSLYKLRSDVMFDLEDDRPCYQVFEGPWKSAFQDPRRESLGYRSYDEPQKLMKVAFDVWDEYRIRQEVPDGSRDLIPEKSFIHEGRLDELNAVSYQKGCYMGQELVSRMHHRGLAKKRLQCVSLDAVPEGAELRSHCNGTGLALVRAA